MKCTVYSGNESVVGLLCVIKVVQKFVFQFWGEIEVILLENVKAEALKSQWGKAF